MLTNFFIARPQLSIVSSLLIMCLGVLCYFNLPVTLYPILGAPKVVISGSYPGASPTTIEDTVIRPIEEKLVNINGIEFVESGANANGGLSLSISFSPGVDTLKALIDIQNAVSLAEPQLPETVKQYGLSVSNDSSTLTIAVNLFSANNEINQLFVSNYAAKKIVGELSKIKGVYKVVVFGELSYSMRVWLKPDKLRENGLTVKDIKNAILEQNAIRSVGKIGEPPVSDDQMFEFLVQSPEGLSDVSEFENIVIKATPAGALLLMRDVANIELGSYSYNETARLDNKPSALIGVFQNPDANGLKIAEEVRVKMDELQQSYPFDISHAIRFDKSKYIGKAIRGLILTLIEATIIVLIVVALFLKSWRAAIIPSVVIPISLLGTLCILYQLGSSINVVSLLGMVLAIGIVVDDAIVVVERVNHLMYQHQIDAKNATFIAANELFRPIVATTLVLLAAFIPIIFMPGFTGTLYKEFALTISIAVTISAVCALTLSPALCALVLTRQEHRPVNDNIFTPIVKSLSRKRNAVLFLTLRRPSLTLAVSAITIALLYMLTHRIPSGLVPFEDQGSVTIMAQTPDNSSLNRIESVMHEITNIANKDPAIETTLVVNGFNYSGGNGARNGLAFSIMKDWSARDEEGLSVTSTIDRLKKSLSEINSAQITVTSPASVPGLGSIDGFNLQLKDTYGRSPQELEATLLEFMARMKEQPEVSNASTSFRTNVSQYQLDIDVQKAKILGVNLDDIYEELGTYLGSNYVNNFTLLGRKYKVILQAAPEFRKHSDGISQFYVKGEGGVLISISELVSLKPFEGPVAINHFNYYLSAAINGQVAPGYSLGDVVNKINSLKANMPDGYDIEWTGEARQSIESAKQLKLIIAIAILISYLVLVGIYESWITPFSILVVIPFTILGSFVFMWLLDGVNNVYAQMGLVLLIGMATKTAVLVVDAAQNIELEGASRLRAAVRAVKVRMRAVMMTSIAFICGVAPLLFSSGPGAGAKAAIALPILGGMIFLLFVAIYFIPYFYYWLRIRAIK